MSAFEHASSTLHAARIRATSLDTLMVNVGLRCTSSCSHCHQSCSPARTESMSAEVMDATIAVVGEVRPSLVDITGGAPELHPLLRPFIDDLRGAGAPRIRVRTNLVALLEPGSAGLDAFFADREIELLGSLPDPTACGYTRARGTGFEDALAALRMLAGHGYGADPRLRLDLAVNPAVGDPPLPDPTLRSRFRRELTDERDIPFNDLVVIRNVPVGRLRRRLEDDGALAAYLDAIALEFNEDTLPCLSCRTGIEVAWDGMLADCDFNLGRGMGLAEGEPQTIFDFDAEQLARRPIKLADHCLACTAAAGSG